MLVDKQMIRILLRLIAIKIARNSQKFTDFPESIYVFSVAAVSQSEFKDSKSFQLK